MDRAREWITKHDETWFYLCNQSQPAFIQFFKWITHLGGATLTIGIQLFFILFPQFELRRVAIVAAVALTISHIIVVLIKRLVKRIRPYLSLPNVTPHGHLFKDHSFPSGHSTAIFSVVIPYMLAMPNVTFILLPLAGLVAFSRVVLGVHYPTDIVVGSSLGTITAMFVFALI
ncbi:phosphatase PAP2 family protein [Mangrovibacillus cuniculi]|uniref:Phosphatase PAP2 family protein n=1 Tax=Mangrovibacillus cuniculi TaxID=2593652 RepID=A0A7S8HGT9_9BACI|nr:phosphatase PAP2 family protein [Mangrovibacillus cuniculi]QPC47916.1 phosphatase PAP2 family protein [Mangrovibacillus cuniculi]